MEIKEVFAQNFRMFMALKNLRISDIHKETNISRTTLSNIKNGISIGIQYETLEKLSNILDVKPDEFFKEWK